MTEKNAEPKTIDQYIALFPEETQAILKKIRKTIKKEIPGAEETISYRIPTFKIQGKYVIYFAGFKNHVSIYPIMGDARKKFARELTPHLSGKGTAQFPLDTPIPYGLIARIAKYTLQERLADT